MGRSNRAQTSEANSNPTMSIVQEEGLVGAGTKADDDDDGMPCCSYLFKAGVGILAILVWMVIGAAVGLFSLGLSCTVYPGEHCIALSFFPFMTSPGCAIILGVVT